MLNRSAQTCFSTPTITLDDSFGTLHLRSPLTGLCRKTVLFVIVMSIPRASKLQIDQTLTQGSMHAKNGLGRHFPLNKLFFRHQISQAQIHPGYSQDFPHLSRRQDLCGIQALSRQRSLARIRQGDQVRNLRLSQATCHPINHLQTQVQDLQESRVQNRQRSQASCLVLH